MSMKNSISHNVTWNKIYFKYLNKYKLEIKTLQQLKMFFWLSNSSINLFLYISMIVTWNKSQCTVSTQASILLPDLRGQPTLDTSLQASNSSARAQLIDPRIYNKPINKLHELIHILIIKCSILNGSTKASNNMN